MQTPSLKQIKLLMKAKTKEIDSFLASKKPFMTDAVILATELKNIEKSMKIIEVKLEQISNK